ncbi:sulfatase-like hydrolase/transferase [Nonomuraea sp. NBC_00507]|uniref:sulfatase-like hydrolase/transferase n=1 Tax=Nonomuraea sp. NBC_00507 TaxID=2976002 RepID=UPI002E17F84E
MTSSSATSTTTTQGDYPTEEEFPGFRKRFGPRGVIHSWANPDGTQRIEDTGPLGIGDDTIVMYSTDNGPHMNTWPDGAMTPFRNEKNSNWEGAYRVPAVVRWPGKIPAGTVLNGIVSHNDWFVTLLAATVRPPALFAHS